MFTITAQAIDQMMQAPSVENATPYSYEALVELYQKLDFAKRAQTLELFLTQDNSLPKKNAPCSSSIFPKRATHNITVVSYLLGYYSNQWVDEAIIGFLSIFSTDSKPSIMFNLRHFLSESIHQQLVKFPTEVFKYASVLVQMFLYFHGNDINLSLQSWMRREEATSHLLDYSNHEGAERVHL